MWKCKECGCSDIVAEYSGDWVAYKKVINKYGETENVKIDEMENIGGHIYQYYCNKCGNCAEDIEDIAEWID